MTAAGDRAIGEALVVLRAEFAGTGWIFGTVWASLVGPGVRRLTASRGAVLLAARDLAEMRRKLSHEQKPRRGVAPEPSPEGEAARPSSVRGRPPA